MKFTALEEYGLRCILHLARADCAQSQDRDRAGSDAGAGSGAAPAAGALTPPSLTLGEIAEREGLTQQYAGKIFRILAKAGLVESERGRNGGYRMTRNSETITISEVLAALGGRFFDRKVCGRYTGDRNQCVHSTNCAIRTLWLDVQRMVDLVLAKTTLRDLVEREASMAEALRALPEDLVYVTTSGQLRAGSLMGGDS